MIKKTWYELIWVWKCFVRATNEHEMIRMLLQVRVPVPVPVRTKRWFPILFDWMRTLSPFVILYNRHAIHYFPFSSVQRAIVGILCIGWVLSCRIAVKNGRTGGDRSSEIITVHCFFSITKPSPITFNSFIHLFIQIENNACQAAKQYFRMHCHSVYGIQ